jgi:hypothetical protein
MADSSTVRQRKPDADTATVAEKSDDSASASKKRRRGAGDDDAYSPWLDILRVLTFLLIASCGLSYLVSGGETWFWYYGKVKPPFMTLNHWKAKFVRDQCQ